MTFDQMINSLVSRKFSRMSWRNGSYIYYGDLKPGVSDKPSIILYRPGRPLKQFGISKLDISGRDWYEV